MQNELTELIEKWFVEQDDGEFASGGSGRDYPYWVIGPASDSGYIVFATKQHITSAVISDGELTDEIGMIARGGLPSQADIQWMSGVIGACELLFLGDMDPVDLMVFAWLRAALYPKRVTHVGINDGFLKAVKISSIKTLWFSCTPSERQSLVFLKKVFPDIGKTIGKNCTRMLRQGQKIELDGFGGKKQRLAIANLIRSHKNAEW